MANQKNGLGGNDQTAKLKECGKQMRYCIDEALPGGDEYDPCLGVDHKDELDHKVK